MTVTTNGMNLNMQTNMQLQAQQDTKNQDMQAQDKQLQTKQNEIQQQNQAQQQNQIQQAQEVAKTTGIGGMLNLMA